MYISDLHIHSRYSRATSKEGDPEHLELWARKKGIHIVGTGDFTHPAWREELKEKLEPAEDGLYKLKKEYQIQDGMTPDHIDPRFVITGEISSIYKKNGKTRKVHSLLILPGLEDGEKLSRKLETIGNIHSDGRPILGLDCRDLLEIMLELSPAGIFVPAHIWTPHFAMFGAFSGFDSMEECFGDLTSYVHAVETGLSSDPPMNWRVSNLDRCQLISNSDAHSPAKLGREANLMEMELSYEGLEKAIQKGEGLYGTVEFFPEEGKYHYDGHRKCHLCLSPAQTEKYGGKCPVCGRKLTIGVEHRVEELADREEGYVRKDARAFESLIPLPEVIGEAVGRSASSVKVQSQYGKMLTALGSEFEILRQAPIEDIRREAGYRIAEGIRRLRAGEVERRPGFDGEYGTIKLFRPAELEDTEGQMSLFEGMETIPEQEEPPLPLPETGEKAAEEKHEKETVQPGPVLLNEKQREAVEAVERVTAVIAGPGTGKTKTLVSKILYLLERRKVKSSQITAVTFTNKAADEMKERLSKELGGKRFIRLMQAGTFHSICLDFLKREGIDFSLGDEMQTKELAEEVIKSFSLNLNALQFLREVSLLKTRKKEDRKFFGTGLKEEAFEAYQKALEDRRILDFDDLLLKTLELLEEREERKGQSFYYLLVDEFQDINPVQYELIKKWNQGGRELFVIGDPDQSIYGFRGSDPLCFDRLEKEEPKTRIIRLEKNYRSTKFILEAAEAVINKNPGGLRSLTAFCQEGEQARLVEASSGLAEGIFVAKEINRQVGGVDMLDTELGYDKETRRGQRSFGDIGVLYRTRRQSGILEKCLRQEGIPYVVAGRDDFLLDNKVRGTVCFFRSLEEESDALSRSLALRLLWDLPENSLTGEIYEDMKEKYKPLLKKAKPQKILETWRKDLGLEENEAVEKLWHMTVFYKNMRDFLESLSLGGEGDLYRCGGKSYTADAVRLMTLHGAKGLEFPVVFLCGAQKGTIPFESEKNPADWEEERRLLFVGMTRAREELFLTCAKEPSEFLEDLPSGLFKKEKTGKKAVQARQLNLFDFM